MKVTSKYIGCERDSRGWEHTKWECKVKVGKRVARVTFRMGMAHTCDPDALGVIASLLSDANAGAQPFAAFCDDFGYTDPAPAYDAWRGCRAAARKVAWLWPNGVPESVRTKCENF